jgi:GTPase SAR1 family protein
VETVIPAIGIVLEVLELAEATFYVFDVGGSDKLHGIYQRYYSDIDGVIFFIDGKNFNWFYETKEQFEIALSETNQNCPILLVINKAYNEEAVLSRLKMDRVHRPWHVVEGKKHETDLSWLMERK